MDTNRIHSFGPIEDENAEVLVLGSMPGRASLKAMQYYAHPQNAFWRLIAELLKLDAALPYEARIQALKTSGIAVWDVLQSCTREGSLDASIESDTHTANDFHAFFLSHPKITRVFFNGAKAEECFKRHGLGKFAGNSVSFSRLPSTSPANAALSFAQKLDAWREILKPGLSGQPLQ